MSVMLPSIVEAMAAVMADVQAVGKTGRNQSQNYAFRGIDAVMDAVGPALRAHGVVAVPEASTAQYRDVLVGKNQSPMRECTLKVGFRFYGPAGDSITAEVCAEALDSGDKATSKAHSVAYRTCLLQALTIPTGESDPDEHSHERSKPEPAPPPDPEAEGLRLLIRDAISDGRITAEQAQEAAKAHGVGTAQLLNAASAEVMGSLVETLGLVEKTEAPVPS